MSTLAMPSGAYRAASLRQVWVGRLNTVLAGAWQAGLRASERVAASRFEDLALRLQSSHPDLASELRQMSKYD
jgi:hypothetical protein